MQHNQTSVEGTVPGDPGSELGSATGRSGGGAPSCGSDPQMRLAAAIAVLGAVPLDLALGEEVVDLQREARAHLGCDAAETG